MAKKFFSILGQCETPGRAMQQLSAHLFFQAPNLMTNGRLREIQPLASPCESANFFHRNEGA
jgi:hypothetical protein